VLSPSFSQKKRCILDKPLFIQHAKQAQLHISYTGEERKGKEGKNKAETVAD
jgi:hypothetical protein